jgi:1-phosphofructokinase family hexose kinase
MTSYIQNNLNSPILTVTLNPVLDRTLNIKGFKAGGTFKADRSDTFAGGKGVNVSRALRAFGVDSTATGIIAAGGSDMYIALLEKDYIKHDFLKIDGFLRTNVTIVSGSGRKETHIRERGPSISAELLEEFENKIRSFTKKGMFIVFSGSLPEGLPDKTYSKLINEAKSAGAGVFFDASGLPFKRGIKEAPLFIKPNAAEVKDALGFRPEPPVRPSHPLFSGNQDVQPGPSGLTAPNKNLLKAVSIFHSRGIDHVMISLGKNGLIYSKGGKVVYASSPVPSPVNTVGSGDAALAGGIIGIINKFDTAETARFACALGAANTQISGACVFSIGDAEKYYNKTEISVLSSG